MRTDIKNIVSTSGAVLDVGIALWPHVLGRCSALQETEASSRQRRSVKYDWFINSVFAPHMFGAYHHLI